MGKHNEIGKEGEDFAVQYLINKGYKIIDTNWRYNHKEIDIISRQGDKMVFAEVKTRTSAMFNGAKDTISIKKMKNLMVAANAYLLMNRINIESRFDIITVKAGSTYKITEHIEDAFKPNDLL